MAIIKGTYKVLNNQGTYDTVYMTTNASQVIQTEDREFVTPAQKVKWDGKAEGTHKHVSSDITDATNANTANKIVKRDSNGNFSAGTITATLSGNASSATKLATARTINGVAFDGTANITIKADPNSHNHDNLYKRKTDDYKITPKKLVSGENINALYQSGFYVSDSDSISSSIVGTPSNKGFALEVREIYGSGASGRQIQIATVRETNEIFVRSKPENGTWTSWTKQALANHNHDSSYAAKSHTHTSSQISDATNANTANMIVKRDGNGNFSAGTITASLSGNASTATKWKTARNVAIGNATKPMDGTANVSFSLSEIGAASSNHTHTLLIANATAIGSGKNLNDYQTPGAYYQDSNANASTANNYPEAQAGSLIVYKAAGIIQEYKVYNSSRVYIRSYYNGTWTAWTKEYNTANKPTANEIGAAPTSHNHNTGNVTALTGYSKPSSTSALSTSDTLNTALGKLEKALDGKSNSHSHPYRPDTWVPSWSDITGKPSTFNPASHTHGANEINKMTNYAKGTTTSAIAATDTLNQAISKLEVALDGKSNTHTHPYRSNTWVPAWSDVTNKPTFATVATSGSYADLTNKPTIHTINDSTTTSTTNTWSAKKINDSLAGKAASSHTHAVADITGLGSAATLTAGTSANNVLKLDSAGKVPVSVLPSIAINETFTAADKAAALKLTVEVGDIVIVTADAKTYICVDKSKTVFDEKFKALSSGTDTITKVEVENLLNNKVDKVSGKGLSTNDFTAAYKTKLDGIAANANNYVHPNDANTRHVTDAEKSTWNGKAAGNHNHDSVYLKLAGGTVSGAITKNGSGAGFIIANGTSRTMVYASTTAGEHLFGGNNNNTEEMNDYIRIGSNKLKFKTEGNEYDIYHAGNKPTPSAIGAASSSHTHNKLKGTKNSTVAPATEEGVLRYDYNISSNVAGNMPNINNANGILTVNTHEGNYYSQLGFSSNGNLYHRAFNGAALDSTTAWKQLAFTNSSITGNAATATKLQTARTINGTNFDGSGNITTANWGTGRTITIGNTGKTVNGSANVSWSLSEIGAAAVSHGNHVPAVQTADARKFLRNDNTWQSLPTASTSATGIVQLTDSTSSTSTTTAATANSVKLAYDLANSKANSSHSHTNMASRGRVAAEEAKTRPAASGLSMTEAYNNGYPTPYGNVMTMKGSGDGQLLIGWSGTSGAHAPAYIRSKRDTGDANWSGWAQIYTTAHKPSLTDLGIATLTRGSYLTGSNYNGTGNTTWAVDASTTATASKVVARDGSGDVHCRLVRSEYANQSTISGAIAFRTNNSTDNYVRFCSDTTAIRTFLNTYSKSETYTRSEMDNRYRQKSDLVFTDTISIVTPSA